MKATPVIGLMLCFVASLMRGETTTPSDSRRQRAEAAAAARIAYAHSAAYNPYDSEIVETRDRAAQRLDAGKFNDAIAEADAGLKRNPFDVDLLVIKAAALRESGKTAPADATRQQWMAIVDSILLSGDGKSYATAYRVISVSEEYALLRILHLKHSSQALVTHDRSQYDVFTIQDPLTGVDSQVYFNIDLPKDWLDRHFRHSTEAEPTKPNPSAASATAKHS